MKIFVGNLPFDIDERELRDLFSQYGEVLSVAIRRDPEFSYSRGTGFVDMLNESDGFLAIDALTGYKLHNCNLRVNEARDRITFKNYFQDTNFIKSIGEYLSSPTLEDAEVNYPLLQKSAELVVENSRVINNLVEAIQDKTSQSAIRASAGMLLGLLGDPRADIVHCKSINFCMVNGGGFWFYSDDKKITNLDYTYWISQYPISNAQFQEFVDFGGYSDARYWKEAIDDNVWNKGHIETFNFKLAQTDYGIPYNLPNHPVVGINWYEASAFAAWLTDIWHLQDKLPKQYKVVLPSEQEWVKAARGGILVLDNASINSINTIDWASIDLSNLIPHINPRQIYPWGNNYDSNTANLGRSDLNCSTALGVFSDDISIYGCREMAGNVLEWTRSVFEFYKIVISDNVNLMYEAITFKGGSSTDNHIWGRCDARSRDFKNYQSSHRGFRIAIVPIKELS